MKNPRAPGFLKNEFYGADFFIVAVKPFPGREDGDSTFLREPGSWLPHEVLSWKNVWGCLLERPEDGVFFLKRTRNPPNSDRGACKKRILKKNLLCRNAHERAFAPEP
jgi:hypothetical protein